MSYAINKADVTCKKFKGRGPGGQNKNKVESCVRLIHKPTGIKVEATRERDYTKNLVVAWEMLQEKLDNLAAEQAAAAKRKAYQAKPDAAFSSQIRSYVLSGSHQQVIDHRSGFKHPRPQDVLNGDLDGVIRSLLSAGD